MTCIIFGRQVSFAQVASRFAGQSVSSIVVISLRYVRVVYIKCSDSNGSFDSPDNVNNSLDNASQKLRFNALLLQTFMAEEMNRHGFGYQTFELEENDTAEVLVHVFTSELSTEKAHQMNGDELYNWFHKGNYSERSKGVVIISLVEVSSCSKTGSIRGDPYSTSRKNSLELIELSSINKVSLV